MATERQLKIWKTKFKLLQKQYKQLNQDAEDMRSSIQTTFKRCPKCLRISDIGWCCFYCGHDAS